MSRRLLLAATGVAALAVAIVLALVGRAVLATPAAVAQEGRDWPAGASVRRRRGPAERAAARLLAAARAERIYAIARAYRQAAAAPVAMTTDTPVQLAELAAKLGPASERSTADVMVGAVYALPAGNGSLSFAAVRRLGGGRLLDQAAGEFQRAVATDDRNEAAKYDLELLLKRAAPSRASRRQGKPSTHQGTRRQHSRQRRSNRRIPARRHAGAIYANGSGY